MPDFRLKIVHVPSGKSVMIAAGTNGWSTRTNWYGSLEKDDEAVNGKQHRFCAALDEFLGDIDQARVLQDGDLIIQIVPE